jgi:acyl-coenzyme A thioesterase PaaI-like protein
MSNSIIKPVDAADASEFLDDQPPAAPVPTVARIPEREPVRPPPAVRAAVRPLKPGRAQRLYDFLEVFLSRLSMRDNFWHSVCSLLWLPLAFFSGIRMKQINTETFSAILPFRRFNRNWYRAMAGGALLANSEIAGGMYVFGVCGADYTVVCKNLNYTFLRPCFGPAVYRMTPRENIREAMSAGTEFNITLDLEILQQASRQGEKDKRVGRCEATFHVTPKIQHKLKAARKLTK